MKGKRLSDYLFLTGGTGLLGRYLIRDLMEQGQRLALLVRGGKRESAQDRIEGILQFWENQSGQSLPRPVLIEGDLRQPNLGLSQRDMSWLSRHCPSMMHSAASLEFHSTSDGEPWKTNVDGTQSVLQLFQSVGMKNMHYVSTAYVCGLREGRILETELDMGQEFRNDYERSKLHAEQMVRDSDFIRNLTVYRPAVISGDSKTGYTNTYHGIYLYLRLMALFVPMQPVGPDGKRVTKLRMPMSGDERRNVVPVDWVSAVMTQLYMDPQAHGHTFHLAPDECLTPRKVIDAGATYYNSTGLEWVGHGQVDPATYNDLEAASLPGLAMYNNYDQTDPTFDCSNVKRFAGNLPCPIIDEEILHTYLRFGEQDRWGKRRMEKPTIGVSATDYFSDFQVWEEPNRHGSERRLAIDLFGPGGGQWTLGLNTDGSLVCSAGVHGDADSLLRLPTSEFFEIISKTKGTRQQQVLSQLFPLSLQPQSSKLRTVARAHAD